MATTKRRINFTNRKRISHEAIDIRLLDTPPGAAPRATAELKLDGLGFPETAEVAIEAYRGSSLMRFGCGTVGNLSVPPLMIIDDIDVGGNVQFRVKVVDTHGVVGLLAALASHVRPKSKDDGDGRRSLLTIRYHDLGSELWRVSVDENEPPALVLNYRATGIEDRIINDPLVRGLLMPAAFRIVLEKLVLLTPPDEDDETDWKRDWLKFCEEELGIEDSPFELDKDERAEWIDEAVKVFSSRATFLEKVRAKAGEV